MRWAAAFAAFLVTAGAATAAAATAPSIAFDTNCVVAGAPPGSRCGTLRVDEDRSRARGRRLTLRFVVVPGRAGAPADPIFYVAGGPGESAVEGLPAVLATLRSVEPDRAVVFLDQRGTGASNALGCGNALDLIAAADGAEALRACAARLRARADLDRYGSMDAAADLEDLRAALGYPRINLVGVSYGVRVALLYLREHRQRVRSAILRAAYPVDYNILADGGAAADAALARLLEDCRVDQACGAAFPGLAEQLRTVDARLDAAPARVTVQQAGGASVEVPVSRELFHQLLLLMMQAAESRQYVPLLISTAATRGFQPFATPIAQLRTAFSGFPLGMYLSVLCTEDAPRWRFPSSAPATPLFATVARVRALCGGWPVRPAPASALAPFTSDVPTLIVSGALDPVTPVAAAERLAASLSQSTHIVLPATAHGPMFPECARPTVAAFIRTATGQPLGSACDSLALPAFALPEAAPAAVAQPTAPQAAAIFEGTWDLEFQTRRGPAPGGYLVVRQRGERLDAELHGQGSLEASGTLQGNAFTLRGSRFFVGFTLSGTVGGDAIEGVLKVASIERRFVGRRRIAPADGDPR